MKKLILFVLSLALIPLIADSSFAYFGDDMIHEKSFSFNFDKMKNASDIITINEPNNDENFKRYIVFSDGSVNDIRTVTQGISSSISSSNGFFSIVTIAESNVPYLQSKGFHMLEDFQLDFHSKYLSEGIKSKVSEIGNLANSKNVHSLYNVTGKGIRVAIVDTGVDFSNPDMQHAVARDDHNIPIMLDADGQGIILTNATFAANIDQYGTIKNFTKSKISELNTTSSVYVKPRNGGIYLLSYAW